MASSSSSTSLLLLLLFTALCCSASCFEYQVGGPHGWAVPPPNHTALFNHWASLNRFQVSDSLRFRYKKDSVMEVEQEGYNTCNSSHPNMFSNDGNTLFKFDHPGSFYFISGASGHCHKGQKMIVRVLPRDLPHLPLNASSAFRLPPSLPALSLLLCFHILFAFLASHVV